jgi:hypothetical protein
MREHKDQRKQKPGANQPFPPHLPLTCANHTRELELPGNHEIREPRETGPNLEI